MMPRSRWALFLEVSIAIVALSGCGGGGEPASSLDTSAATVKATGAAPVPSPAQLSFSEDQSVRSRLIATDADDDALTFAIGRPPAHATVTLDGATGVFELRPAANYFGADTFEFTVTDGHGNQSSAQVAIEIKPMADPPAIDATAIPAVVAAGSEARIPVAVTDPDGDAVTLAVSQVGGPVLPGFRLSGGEVQLAAPAIDAATNVELLFEATDSTGLVTRRREVITLSPVSRSPNLFTLKGRPDGEGLHWVITGDGFTADEQQDLVRAAIAMAKGVTDAPELARHAAILNIHVLTAVSRDSGVDTGATRTRRTAFDGSLGCAGVERIACVSWDKVSLALIAARVPFDEVAVVLNTDTYAGSATASGLIVSRHPKAPAITLHEMGHLLASLGDEYVDDALAGDAAGKYREGMFANVTTNEDPTRIPWRHWFVDPLRIPGAPGDAGVGRFQGAFYSASGFYRPTQNSIMRSLDGALGVVNAEAWLRSLYRAVPPLGAAYPARRGVIAPAGSDVEFEIVSPWPAELMTVRWFVDGSEVTQAGSLYHYEFQGDGGEHEVRVTIEDATGSIRAPAASEQRSSYSWRVSGIARNDTLKADMPSPRIGGWIRMHIDSTGHHVLGTDAGELQRAPLRQALAESAFGYALYDGNGAVLMEGQVADPRQIRGPLALPGAPGAGHTTATMPEGDYLIGIPEGVDARRLRIRRLDGSMQKATLSEQWLDL
jgi:hypothetical protein